MPEVAAVVHTEICKILHHDHVILGGQFTDDLKFFFLKTDPRWIVRI